MPNVKNIISCHNNKILAQSSDAQPTRPNCNCRNPECPLDQKCLYNNIVYTAEVKSNGTNEDNNSFKSRFSNHKKSFNHARYEKETKLSKYIWKLKRNEKKFTLSWSITKRAPAYSPGSKHCGLCIEEKLCLMQGSAKAQLNKRSEIFAKCRHREKFSTGNFKDTRTQERIT